MSFSSICATITLLRSPNVLTPHLVSGSLLLPPFTQRSPRNSVEKNVNADIYASPTDPPLTDRILSFSSICFQKLARRRARSVGFVERVVVTPLAWHTPEKTDRRVELGRFSRFSKLIPRRRIGLCRFPRFVQLSPC